METESTNFSKVSFNTFKISDQRMLFDIISKLAPIFKDHFHSCESLKKHDFLVISIKGLFTMEKATYDQREGRRIKT